MKSFSWCLFKQYVNLFCHLRKSFIVQVFEVHGAIKKNDKLTEIHSFRVSNCFLGVSLCNSLTVASAFFSALRLRWTNIFTIYCDEISELNYKLSLRTKTCQVSNPFKWMVATWSTFLLAKEFLRRCGHLVFLH